MESAAPKRTIDCAGTSYQIGYTHGSLAKSRILNGLQNYRGFFENTGQISWLEANRLANLFVPALQAHTPHLLEEMRGIAEGAGVPLVDILTMNARSEIALTTSRMADPMDGCTAFAKQSASGQFLAQNWDWMAAQLPEIVILRIKTPEGRRIITVTEAGIVAKVGINDRGVGVTLNALKTVQMKSSMLPIHIALRVVLESNSALEAISSLERMGVASAAHFLIADANTSVGVEVNPIQPFGKLLPDEHGCVFHTNHCIGEELPKELTEVPWLVDSVPRLSRVANLVSQIPSQSLGFDSIFQVFKDEDRPPNSINRQVDPTAQIGICTVFNIMMNCTTKEVRIRFGRPTEGQDAYKFDDFSVKP